MPLDLTTIPDRHDRTGSKTRKLVRVTGPTSYVAGGEALNFGITRPEVVLSDGATNGTDLRIVLWDYAAGKLKWFDLAGAEIAGGQNLSTYSARLEVIGV